MSEMANFENDQTSGGMWFLNHLPAILWQRRWYMLVPFLVLFLTGVVVAYSLPTLYRSNATLLVESPDLPTDLTATAGAPGADIEDRLAKIREQVLSRGDLISLIEQNDLYASERGSKPMSYLVDKMRKATTVGSVAGEIGDPAAKADNVIAVTLSFDYPDATKSQAVMQGYVTKFLQKDNDQIQDQADVAVRFLQDQATKLESQINDIESHITALKAANGAALAGGATPMLMDTGSYTAQIANLESENRQLLAQSKNQGEDPQIAAAEAALAQARATYSDNHPDVIQARERLAELKRMGAKSNAGSTIQQQIQANNAAIAQLRAAQEQAIGKANATAAGQARAPAILEQASQLEDQANALRDQYKTVSDNLLKAQGNARLASEQRGERLSLVDPPNLPDRPHWPNRPLFIAAGAVAGLVVGALLALLTELLQRPIRSPAQLEGMGLPVLGLVPVFETSQRKPRFRLFKKRDIRLA